MAVKQRIVLSGGPGTGKTTLIWALEELGFNCLHEISREIIQEQLARGSNILPWQDLPAFSDKVFAGRKTQFYEAKPGLNFYDRSLIDAIAYMQKDQLIIPEKWKRSVKELRYADPIFITPPWREIFGNDHERRESWEQLLEIHDFLVSAYQEAGYSVLILPHTSVKERLAFILDQVQ